MPDPIVALLGFRFPGLSGPNRDTMENALTSCPPHQFQPAPQQNLPNWIATHNPVAIVATGNDNIRTAQAATTTIPIIMAPATGNPNFNHIADPANVTGVTTYGPPATGFQGSNAERVLRFAAAVPTLTRLAILKFQTTDTDEDLTEILSALPATITAHEVWQWSTVPQLQALFNNYQTRKNNGDPTLPNGLLVMADFHNFIQSIRQIIIARANALDLTAMYPAAEFVADGGPRSFGPVMSQLFTDIADYVCTALGGKTPPPPPPPPPPKWSTPSAWEELP